MRKVLAGNPWLAAAAAWLFATVLVTLGFAIYLAVNDEPFQWSIMRDAALMAAPLALFRAWRDSRAKKAE